MYTVNITTINLSLIHLFATLSLLITLLKAENKPQYQLVCTEVPNKL